MREYYTDDITICNNSKCKDMRCQRNPKHIRPSFKPFYFASFENTEFCYKERSKTMTDILKTEYSEEFDKLRKNRVEMSYFKYGSAKKNFGEGRVDAIGSLELCIDKFKKTGNTEYLLDAANYAMFRYMFPMPGEFFKATDSSESAGTVGTPINFERGF